VSRADFGGWVGVGGGINPVRGQVLLSGASSLFWGLLSCIFVQFIFAILSQHRFFRTFFILREKNYLS